VLDADINRFTVVMLLGPHELVPALAVLLDVLVDVPGDPLAVPNLRPIGIYHCFSAIQAAYNKLVLRLRCQLSIYATKQC
jgi:hypothetical protein